MSSHNILSCIIILTHKNRKNSQGTNVPIVNNLLNLLILLKSKEIYYAL